VVQVVAVLENRHILLVLTLLLELQILAVAAGVVLMLQVQVAEILAVANQAVQDLLSFATQFNRP
jgi:hypothetical protein